MSMEAKILEKKKTRKTVIRNNDSWRYFLKHKYLYFMLLPAIVYYIIFHYVPMYGAIIAFKNFNVSKGILGSEWIGLANFKQLFKMDKFYQVVWNTLTISLKRLIVGFPTPIIIALLLNEVKRKTFKKTIQTVIYLPHFISWVILGGMLVNLLSVDNGLVNGIITAFGGSPIGFLTDDKYFVKTLVVSMVWKEFGWNTIIYMAALSGINPQLYEAAIVDGASRWKQTIYITIPCIMSTIVVVFILRLGGLMEAGFEQIFVLYHPGVYKVADIIDTYVYRTGLTEGKFAMASAVGLFKSLINFILLISANKMARMVGEEGVF